MKLLFIGLIIVTAACQSTKESRYEGQNDLLKKALTGEWRNTYLKVTMNSFKGRADSVYILEADSSNWEDVLKLKPIRTFFKADGTYHSDHYAVSNALLFSASGKWTFSGDTLVMTQTRPNAAVFRLKTTIKDNTATFSGMLDFDEDGQRDDLYFGKQQKQ